MIAFLCVQMVKHKLTIIAQACCLQYKSTDRTAGRNQFVETVINSMAKLIHETLKKEIE